MHACKHYSYAQSARCTTNSMARVLFISVVLVIFIQLASSQIPDRACLDATDFLVRQCNDDNVCRNPCSGYFDDVISACGNISGVISARNLVRSMYAYTHV